MKKILLVSIVILISSMVFTSLETEKILPQAVQEKSHELCTREFKPAMGHEPYYMGKFFDAHFHLPPTFEMTKDGYNNPRLNKDITFEEILCLFDKEKTTGAIMFFEPDEKDLDSSLKSLRELSSFSKDYDFKWFLSPGDLSPETIKTILDENKGLFSGIGEIAFHGNERTPGDHANLEIYKIAAINNLVVMIHPGLNQRPGIEKAVKDNPGVKFLLHGYEIEGEIPYLLDKYQNIYYSLDSVNLFKLSSTEQFEPYLRNNFESILSKKILKWKSIINRHPTRLLWATDRYVPWQFDEELNILTEEFFRAFAGRLD